MFGLLKSRSGERKREYIKITIKNAMDKSPKIVVYVRRIIQEMKVASQNVVPSSATSVSPIFSLRVSLSCGEYYVAVSLGRLEDVVSVGLPGRYTVAFQRHFLQWT